MLLSRRGTHRSNHRGATSSRRPNASRRTSSDEPSLSLAPDGWTLAFIGLDERRARTCTCAAPANSTRAGFPALRAAATRCSRPTAGRSPSSPSTQLKTIAVHGGGVTTLTTRQRSARPGVGRRHTPLVYRPESISGLIEISTRGGRAANTDHVDDKAGERTHRWPHVLPGGRWILFTVGTTASPDDYDGARIDAIDRATGERRRVFEGASMVRYAPDWVHLRASVRARRIALRGTIRSGHPRRLRPAVCRTTRHRRRSNDRGGARELDRRRDAGLRAWRRSRRHAAADLDRSEGDTTVNRPCTSALQRRAPLARRYAPRRDPWHQRRSGHLGLHLRPRHIHASDVHRRQRDTGVVRRRPRDLLQCRRQYRSRHDDLQDQRRRRARTGARRLVGRTAYT